MLDFGPNVIGTNSFEPAKEQLSFAEVDQTAGGGGRRGKRHSSVPELEVTRQFLATHNKVARERINIFFYLFFTIKFIDYMKIYELKTKDSVP